MGAGGGPQSDRSLAGAPEDLIRGALDGQADTMQRRPGYVMDIAVLSAITNFRTCDNDKTIRKVCDNDKR